MRRLAWIDGRVVEASEFRPRCPYVMQRVHTLRGRAYFLARHLELLREGSERLFGFASLCSVADAEAIIADLVARSRLSPMFSAPIALRLMADGELCFEVEMPTYGEGTYLRAKRFEAVVVRARQPLTMTQTTATVAEDALSDRYVAQFGGDRAIWVDGDMRLISRPWLPIFASFRDTVYTPAEYASVEYLVAAKAIHDAGYTLVVRDIPESSLQRMEELFMVDIMGVSSFARIGHHRLLSSVASRVAAVMMPKP